MPYKKRMLRGYKRVSASYHTDDIDMVRSIARMQFGIKGEETLLNGDVSFVRSVHNNRIRNIYCNGEHILSLRAEDGYFTLKIAGAKKLMAIEYPRFRVIVDQESEQPNKEGRNVFAKFVVDADKDLIIGNETMVVNGDDELLAVGRALMTREEMLSFKRGGAVKVRQGTVRAHIS